ncbi:MAG: hypothetical protein J7J20_03825 [Desulfurococcales archaeon]|nr:hypothetical protein [Desulfurococcales archaeon]
MGLEALQPILNWFTNVSSGGIASWLAIAGIVIIAAVALGYVVYGLMKFAKLVINMKVKEFSLLLLAVGAVFVGLAILLP